MSIISLANRVKVLQKGLILILVPLLFEVVFVLVLSMSLQQAERAAWEASHSQTVLSEASELTLLTYRAGLSLIFYATTRATSFLDDFSVAAREIPGRIDHLKALEVGDPPSREALAKINTMSNRILEIAAQARATAELQNDAVFAEYNWKLDLARMLPLLIHDLNDFTVAVAKVKKIDLAAQDRARNTVIACLAAGVAMNIALAGALVFLFGRGMVQRVKIMIDNTRRVAQSQPLNPQVDGSDEIAELDIFMHKMADDLKLSEEKRKELLAMVSHDLRSPLVALNGSLMLLLVKAVGELDEKVERELERAERNTRRLISMINDLLDVEKMAAGKLEINKAWSSVDDIFDESTIALKGFGDQKELKIEAVKTGLDVYADAPRIVQVVVNLCSNAIKFSPKGGTITIGAVRKDGFVEFSITDQGEGIDAAFKDKLFGRFEQDRSKPAPKAASSGLGLYICKQLVELHGGTIGVDSEPGKGSRFWFKIPAQAGAPCQADSGPPGAAGAAEVAKGAAPDEYSSW